MSGFSAVNDYDSSDLSDDDDNVPVSAWLDEEDDPEPTPIKPVVVEEPKIDVVHKPPYIVAHLDLFYALCEVDDWEFEKLSDEQQEEIMKTLVVETFNAGDKIIVEGDTGNDLFIVVASEATADFAEVEVVTLNQQLALGTEVFLTRLRRGQYFGQKFFITRRATKRGATVRVPIDSTVPVAVARLTMEYFDKWEQFRNLLLVKTVPLIQILPRKERSHILQSLVVREYRDGEYIIRQGEKGEEFFIIQDGAVKVVQQRPSAEKDGPPTEVTLVTLREGHFFGEMSLVSDEPRVASVVSVRNAICFVLSKQAFQSALADESFRQAFNDVLVKRKEIRKQRAEKEHESNDASSSGGLSSSTGSFVTDGSTPKGSLSPQSSLRRFSSRSRQSSHNSSTNNSEVNITTTLSTKKLESGSRVINKYIVERELGKGSFGDVYLCTDQDSNIQYAMKTINRPPSSSWNDEATNAIRQEIAVMKRLKHQNIVFLHEVIDDQNSRKIYLIQEFMEGGALMPDAESCDPMDVKRARKYFRDILRGVCYLHSEGIIHRDIKPQNMLLSGAGVVKIADFGAAVFTGGSVQEKVAFGGTPAFMAPELFLTNTSIDFTKHPGIDVFALGATLYYMVIGRPPWMAKNQIDLAMKIKNIELTFPVEGIDPHLKHLLKLMLAKDYRTRCNLDTIVVDDWVTFEGSEPLFEKDEFFIDAVNDEFQDFHQVNVLFDNPDFAAAPPFKILFISESLVIRTMFHNQINNIHHTITVGAANVDQALPVMRNASVFNRDCNFDFIFVDCSLHSKSKVKQFIVEVRAVLGYQGKIICMKTNNQILVATSSAGANENLDNNFEDLVGENLANMVLIRPIGNRELEKLLTTSDLHQLILENTLQSKINAIDDKVTLEEVELAITRTTAATTDEQDEPLDENDVQMLERIGSNMSMLSVPSSDMLGSASSAKDDELMPEYDTSNMNEVDEEVFGESGVRGSRKLYRDSGRMIGKKTDTAPSKVATTGSSTLSTSSSISAMVEDDYDNLQDFDNCGSIRHAPVAHHRRTHRHGGRSNMMLVSNESTASMFNDIGRMSLGSDSGNPKSLVRKRGFMVVPYANTDPAPASTASSTNTTSSASSSMNDPAVLFDRPLKIFSLKEEASRRERREVAMRHSKLAQQYREAHKRGEPGVLSPSQTLSSSKSLLHMVRQQSVQQNRRSFFEKKSSRGSFCGGSGGKHDSPSLLSMNSSASMRARSRTSSDVSMRQIDAFINNKVDDIREKLLDDTIDVDAIGVGGPLVDGDDLSSSSSEDDEDSLMDGDSSSDDDETYDDDIVQLDGDAFDDEFAKFTPKKIESNEAQEMAEWNHIIVGADLSHRLISSSGPEGDATPGSASSSYNPAMGVKYAKHEDIVTRSYMEDRSYACVNIPGCGEDFRPLALFAVFDGHSGDYVAAHLQNQYVNVFTNVLKDVERDAQMQHFSFEARMEKVFEETNLKIDRELLEKDFQRQQKNIKSGIQDIQTYAGSVAAVAVVVPFIPSIQSVYNIKSGVEVFISHIGDCRAVLSRDGQAIQLTEDHKPTVRSERNRIEMAGGWVQNGRVNGGLGVSRSFGDIQFKSFSHCTGFVGDETSPRGIWGVHQQVISKPDFYHFIVDDSSYEFMILASDGLWDVFPSQDAVNFVRKRLVTDRDLNKAAQALVQKAIQKGTQDNTSVVIVAFNQ